MIKLILIAALLFVSGASMAQKVVNVGGAAIIDCRAMPAGSITTDKKARVTDATNTTMGTNDLNNLASAESNKTVSHYFEVMKADVSPSNWRAGFNSCNNYNNGDGIMTWRAPTQRELMLIWTLQETLVKKVPGFNRYNTGGNHWTATEVSATITSTVNFANGVSNVISTKADAARMRCVRDLDPQ